MKTMASKNTSSPVSQVIAKKMRSRSNSPSKSPSRPSTSKIKTNSKWKQISPPAASSTFLHRRSSPSNITITPMTWWKVKMSPPVSNWSDRVRVINRIVVLASSPSSPRRKIEAFNTISSPTKMTAIRLRKARVKPKPSLWITSSSKEVSKIKKTRKNPPSLIQVRINKAICLTSIAITCRCSSSSRCKLIRVWGINCSYRIKKMQSYVMNRLV